jgi:uncharacterized protein YrrD
MLRSVKNLLSYVVLTLDGEIGKVEDFYFDNKEWVIRYFAVALGGVMAGKKVLLPPSDLIDKPDAQSSSIALNIGIGLVENSPDIDTQKPVTRKNEKDVHNYYSLPFYWTQSAYSGVVMPGIVENIEEEPDIQAKEEEGASHLHSAKDLLGYGVDAVDQKAGSIDDMIVDDGNWKIMSVAATMKEGVFWKKKFLLNPEKGTLVDHKKRTVIFGMKKSEMEAGPEYDPEDAVNTACEEKNYDYYGRQK